MPIGKLQRKPSNDTLSSMDSTIDSRLSSTDVPKMELLKINYVHQAKQALMSKTREPLQYHPPPIPRLQQQRLFQPSSQIAKTPANFKFAANKKLILSNSSHGNLSPKLSSPPRKLLVNCQPLPPPIIESWQFLQNKRALNSPTKVSQSPPAQKEHGDSQPSCCQNPGSSSCSASDSEECTDSTLSPGCERSNSWDYRSKVSTCDVRRDIARAGVKSRADRIACIEKTECEHGKPDAKISSPSRSPHIKKGGPVSDVVLQINEMFEQHKQQQRLSEAHKHGTPPQPQQLAPLPMKVPNTRLRGFTPAQTLAGVERVELVNSDEDNCVECSCLSEEVSQSRPETTKRNSKSGSSKRVSRIPKPILNDVRKRSSSRSLTLLNTDTGTQNKHNADESLVTDGFDLNTAVQSSSNPLPEKTQLKSNHAAEASSFQEVDVISGLDRQLLRKTRHHQKTKVERVHIRKKRQPLLIINQLMNEPPKTAFDKNFPIGSLDERKTCGYKNCNFSNCPMSTEHATDDSVESYLTNHKRLSLESNTDSGVSFEDQQQLKENNMKNIEKCFDCEEILRQQNAKTKSSTSDMQAYEKQTALKNESPEMRDASGKHMGQINVPTGGKHADPNDLQNFAKKNLTKATTDELLTAAMNNSHSKSHSIKSKQCNIDNDLKNIENRNRFNNNLRKQTIHIDDEWNDVKDGVRGGDVKSTSATSHTSADNCVTIFVRSAEDTIVAPMLNKRASSVSTTSFLSQTSSICSAQSKVTTTSSSSSSSSASTASSLSSCCTASTSSGCGGSNCSVADTQSLCESDKDCCCHLAEACNVTGGIFYNQTLGSVGRASNSSSISLSSSTGAKSDLSRYSSSSTNTTLGCDVGGIFWNSSCFYNDSETADNPCCCSLSSCDSCSYFEGECVAGSVVSVTGDTSHCNELRLRTPATQIYHEEGDCSEVLPQRFNYQLNGGDQQHQQKKFQLMRNSSAEMLLLHNKKLLRKTDAIHDLRPRSMDGVVDSGVSLNGDTGSSPDSSEHMQNQQDSEARRLKRGHVLSELLETERIYVTEMSSILKGYCDQMQSEELMHLVPASLQGKEDLLFGNLHELYTFHNEIFLKDLENCISTTELVALCFVQRRDTFYRLYSFYCQNIPRSERLRETLVDTHLFLQECQKRLGHKLPLAAYLLKPVQRITKYQLLLKDLLRFSDSGSCTKELQKALDCMLIVLKCVNDSMHQVAITGFPSDLSQQGELLVQDSFQIWTESKKDLRLRIKPQQRHIFLYQKSMLFCKQTSKPGHNKSTYQFKHYLKMSQIGLTESVRGDVKRFEVWLQGRQEVHTLQAPTIEIKNKWVAEIKRVLLNQLEELKGEKIKQYALNQRGLRQTTSWDTPNILMGTPQRTISCDGSSESSNRNSNCSSSGDDNCCPPTPATIVGLGAGAAAGAPGNNHLSTATSDKDSATDVCGWSSDYSNSEDEMSIIEDNSTPGSKFIALADYIAMGHSEVSMREGDTVELLKVGCAGWWFVRVLEANAEGWTPAAYLESFNRKSSRSSSRNQERMNLPKLAE